LTNDKREEFWIFLSRAEVIDWLAIHVLALATPIAVPAATFTRPAGPSRHVQAQVSNKHSVSNSMRGT
jgi:hypothetical protein